MAENVTVLDVVRTVDSFSALDVLKEATADIAAGKALRTFALITMDCDQDIRVYHSGDDDLRAAGLCMAGAREFLQDL